MYSKPAAPVSIGKVLDGAFSLWWPSLKLTWPLVLIPKVAAVILMYFQIGATIPAQALQIYIQSPLISVLQVLISLGALGLYCAAFLRVDEFAHGRELALGASISRGFGLWGKAFGLVLIGILVAIPIMVPALMVGSVTTPGQLGSGLALFAVFAFFYGIFFLVIFGRLFLAFPILVVEKKSAVSSIKASWYLTRGYWWRCAAILTILAIVAYAVAFIFGLVVGVMGVRDALHNANVYGLSRSIFLSSMLIGVVSSLVFTPLFYGGLLSIYYDLKMRKEGGDLAGRVEALSPGRA
ncbi:MAG TPA: glycerophosphoryl diester phosphodiesterase membrane domain-containing protein [Steroidobacteraceae bacterium]|jgi:hypothetical protein